MDDLPIYGHMTSLENVSFPSDRKQQKKKKYKTLPDLLFLILQGTKGVALTR